MIFINTSYVRISNIFTINHMVPYQHKLPIREQHDHPHKDYRKEVFDRIFIVSHLVFAHLLQSRSILFLDLIDEQFPDSRLVL